jgi:PAS domain S-box-containing protein
MFSYIRVTLKITLSFFIFKKKMVAIFIQNAALLITLSLLYGIIIWHSPKNKIIYMLLQGIWFGLIAIAAMMMPFYFSSGTIYDGRSVILTLAGFWGGGIAALVSVIIAGAYRIYVGGIGVYAGTATIILCSLTGLFFRRLLKNELDNVKLYKFILIGIVSHLIMLASQLILPQSHRYQVISSIWIPVLIIFPLTFAIIAKLFQLIGRYILSAQKIRDAESLYRTTLLSIGDAIICTDNHGKILQMNKIAENLTGWKYKDLKGATLDKILKILNGKTHIEIESPLETITKKGITLNSASNNILISKSGREIPIAFNGAPIKNENGEITGLVIVLRDQTDEREYLKKLALSETKYREREFWLSESQKAGKVGTYDFDIINDRWSSSEVLDEIFGITGESPRTLESWNSLVHPDHQQEMINYFLDYVVKGKNQFDKEYKIVRQNDNNVCWVLGRGNLTFDKNGNPIRMYGTIIDITKRKLYEFQLQESEERFRKSILMAPIPIMVMDEDGVIINISEGWTHFSGYTYEDIPDLKTWTEKAFGKNAGQVESFISELFKENKTILSREFEIIAKSGDKRIWNFFMTPLGKLASGKKIMLCIAPDITQRKRIQTDLEESERVYRQLFEDHSAVKFLIDPENGQIVKANQAAAEFYGWPVEKLQSMNVSEINVLPMEKISEAMEFAKVNKRIYFDFKHRLANGKIRDVEVFSSMIDIAGKQMLHSIVHDVTEKKKLFDELVIAKNKAEESERLKSAFIANMSHEIRTPLNGILGFTNLLTEEENLTSKSKKEYATIINKSGQGLLKIINDILDISKLETGNNILVERPFDVKNMLLTVYLLFERKLVEYCKPEVLLELEKPETEIKLITDENRLIQVFSNLLDNALRFTHKGYVKFGISKIENNNVEFFVTDTGIGIPKEKHEIIFNRFIQQDYTRSYGGTGLGLAIVKKLLEQMGSEIKMESEPGIGTSFRFKFPIYSNIIEVKEPGENKPEEIISAGKTKILVLEDETVSKLLFKIVLSNQANELFFAETGKEAFEIYESNKPDIILLDIGLPDMDGLSLVRKIREKDNSVYIIAQSAFAMVNNKYEALQAGCNDYITKPINVDLLIEKINKTKEKIQSV